MKNIKDLLEKAQILSKEDAKKMKGGDPIFGGYSYSGAPPGFCRFCNADNGDG